MNAPDKATEIKAFITLVITFLTALWGWVGWAVFIFIFAMVMDYVTGSLAARANNEWSSTVARQGLWHKLGEIGGILVASLCDISVKVILNSAAAPLIGDWQYKNYLTLIVAVWYIFTELGSIIENIGKLGAPMPDWLKKGIKMLQARLDEPSEPDAKPELDPEK